MRRNGCETVDPLASERPPDPSRRRPAPSHAGLPSCSPCDRLAGEWHEAATRRSNEVSRPFASRPFFRKNGYRQVRSPSRTATKLGRTRPELPTGRPTKFGSRRSEGPHPSRRLGTSDHVILLWPGHRVIVHLLLLQLYLVLHVYSCTGTSIV